MDRVLLVMRHAKSSWAGSFSDHDRPLNERGRGAAPRMATGISRLGWMPDMVLCSDAARTRETWALMADVLDHPVPSQVLGKLYLPTVDAWTEAVGGAPAEVNTLLVLSHNPTCEDAVLAITGRQLQIRTAWIARIELRGASWRDAIRGGGQLAGFIGPRDGD
jgi:phosphohistidine phosphatase